jgi:hypothetical protein
VRRAEDTLDPNVFDLNTLELSRIGFLQWDVPIAGGQTIDTRIDCRPEMNIAVDVTGDLYQHPAPAAGPWINTIDSIPPASQVLALSDTTPQPDFTVAWEGQDGQEGSGIGTYDIYCSVDDGPYAL